MQINSNVDIKNHSQVQDTCLLFITRRRWETGPLSAALLEDNEKSVEL